MIRLKAPGFFAIALTAAAAGAQPAPQPPGDNLLFWTQDQRDAGFRALDQMAPGRTIAAGGKVRALAVGKPIAVGIDLDAYMRSQRNAGLLIMHDGRVRFEKYALGFTATGRWTSFSVAKSFTSTMVGAALKDGAIKSLDDKVTVYMPGLRGSVYDDVTVRQLLTMTSGVRWNENYTDPKSDVSLFSQQKPVPGEDLTVSYMKTLGREAPAGSKWVYKTGETNLIGVLVSSATGRKLSDYLSEKVWKPAGMEADGFWITDKTAHEIGGCCMSARLRDYARFGQFVLDGGRGVVPTNWFAQATTKQAVVPVPGRGYGYQWWTNDDGSFAAQGIFGQGIFIDPKRKLVIASNGDWPVATEPATFGAERERLYKAVQAAIDAEDAARVKRASKANRAPQG